MNSDHQPTRTSWSRVLVIANPRAGTKAGVSVNRTGVAELREYLAEVGVNADLVLSLSTPEATQHAWAARQAGYDLVIAAGGDDTIRAVARALLGSDATLGVLPIGSVLNIARALHLPRDPRQAAAVIAQGATRLIDLGTGCGQLFFEAGSVGINAAVFREVSKIDAGDWGGLWRTLWVGLRYTPARMTLTLDHSTVRTRALMVVVSNGPYIGLGFTVAPAARLTDGLFDVRVFQGFTRWELLRHFTTIAFGRRAYSPRIATYRSATVYIATAKPLPARIDNHDLGLTPVLFAVRPQALRVVVPQGS